MNYYIQGDAANADKIKAAFEKLGYNTRGFNFSDGFFYTVERDVHYCNYCIYDYMVNIIKTHPDYKELELPVEPKFKKGDWIACDADSFTLSIKSVKDGNYFFYQGASFPIKDIDEHYHLWTIQDAKDGDVITNGKLIVIFNKLEEPTYKQRIVAYVGLDLCDRLQFTEDTWKLGVDKAMPATKKQRDLLFAKMKEAGYKWDADKKELRKIKPYYDIANFHVGMPVLVRQHNDCKWDYSIFSRNVDNEYWHFAVCNGVSFTQCIPFEGNEHLLGTTDMCDERFINW